jgi:phosphoribosylaminoimidazole carboxylase (NCAIR synthetase)
VAAVVRPRRDLVDQQPAGVGDEQLDAEHAAVVEALGDRQRRAPGFVGDAWFADAAATAPREPDWTRVLAHPQAKLHLYGKAEARRGRKMGHVTCLGATLDDALATAREIKRALGIPGADEL